MNQSYDSAILNLSKDKNKIHIVQITSSEGSDNALRRVSNISLR